MYMGVDEMAWCRRYLGPSGLIQPLFAPDLAAMRQVAGPRVLFAVCQGESDIESRPRPHAHRSTYGYGRYFVVVDGSTQLCTRCNLRGTYVRPPTANSNFLRTYSILVWAVQRRTIPTWDFHRRSTRASLDTLPASRESRHPHSGKAIQPSRPTTRMRSVLEPSLLSPSRAPPLRGAPITQSGN